MPLAWQKTLLERVLGVMRRAKRLLFGGVQTRATQYEIVALDTLVRLLLSW